MASWLSIKVELVEGRGHTFWPRPGRLFAAGPHHTFDEIAMAINRAFARWDMNHMWAFEFEDGQRVSPPADWEDDEEPLPPSTPLSVLAPGQRFSYEFDFGDGWTHLCTVSPGRIDPLEMLGIRPDEPLPYRGWGDIVDQHGRRYQGDDGKSPIPRDPDQSDLPAVGAWRSLPHHGQAPPDPPQIADRHADLESGGRRHLTLLKGGGQGGGPPDSSDDLKNWSMRLIFDMFKLDETRKMAHSTAAKSAEVLEVIALGIDSLEDHELDGAFPSMPMSTTDLILQGSNLGHTAMDAIKGSQLAPLIEIWYEKCLYTDGYYSANFSKQCATVIRKLAKWIAARQIIDEPTHNTVIAITKNAGTTMVDIARFNDLLQTGKVLDWALSDAQVESLDSKDIRRDRTWFIREITPDGLRLESLGDHLEITLAVNRKTLETARPHWFLKATVARFEGTWHLLETFGAHA